MMNPEMMRLAQEQMRRMSPDDLAAMQRQFMVNPDLLKFASESMKNMTADDVRRAAQQLNQARPEDMRAIAQKIASATPEELAAVKAQADAQMSHAMAGARTLKKQGNELHNRGQYSDAAAKYKLAKDTLTSIPSSAAHSLQLQCALNLMACYLKIGKFDECVSEGSAVLAHDSSNVKAYYRRGQAYKELGEIQAAVADLRKASELSLDDETVAEALKVAEEKLCSPPVGSDANFQPSSSQIVVEKPKEMLMNDLGTGQSSSSSSAPLPTADMQEAMKNSMKDPAMQQMLASMMKNISPEMMASMSEQFGMKLSTEDAAKAQQAMSSLSPEDLNRMMIWMERARQGVEVARKTKDWLLGKRSFILAIVLLILAFILHQLGFIG
ncbi:hypothetical protein PR202_ga16319 [Eleusine coracana subsp. coracana]|uniref:Outer envelope protein 61 n=1 Tax=Eleusine coracana subsp. coracana TaxID=191504 RepID=A0AAV5CLC9_ELECO|nr:hypothetical protein QOZ80_6AG0530040 [Eleusine coracana subsp. coracana]GJM99236.1 hypothetical protein PR202_ga16319 [Eleusine coracana subsp. coracana]